MNNYNSDFITITVTAIQPRSQGLSFSAFIVVDNGGREERPWERDLWRQVLDSMPRWFVELCHQHRKKGLCFERVGKAGIKDIFSGKEVLPPVDPYQDVFANN